MADAVQDFLQKLDGMRKQLEIYEQQQEQYRTGTTVTEPDYDIMGAAYEIDGMMDSLRWRIRNDYAEYLQVFEAPVGSSLYDADLDEVEYVLAGERDAFMQRYQMEINELYDLIDRTGLPFESPLSYQLGIEADLRYVEQELGYY